MEPSFILWLLLAEAAVCDKQPLISINKPLMGHEAYQHPFGAVELFSSARLCTSAGPCSG